ncbi:DNA glycosylase [Biscogniauxia marginata]|nr:DNA glycosylase [Biscogniauxia marginata]
MRSSRLLSQETSKLVAAMANPASPPRRITRSSLARFAYGKGDTSVPAAADIEDAIPNTAATATASRKRKRTTTTTTTTTAAAKISPSASPPSSSSRRIKTEEVKVKVKVEAATETKTKAPRRQRKPARKTTDPATGTTVVAPPSDWEEIYSAVRRMRGPGGAAANAPVDTMGCERLADPSASPRDQRFQTLVALMLSSQTKDTVNAAAMRALKTSLPGHSPGVPPGLNLENVLAASPEALDALIRAVGFHNNKTRYLQRAARILRDDWDGDIPDTIDGLVSLPGVGPKMAHLCLSAAWGRTEGVGVDVHVHRITNLWRWNGPAPTRNPEETRAALEAWLPRDRWREINSLLVGLGQAVCLPVGRRCGDCELGLRGLCPAADRKKVLEGRRRREEAAVVSVGKVEVEEEEEQKEEQKGEEVGGTKVKLEDEEGEEV